MSSNSLIFSQLQPYTDHAEHYRTSCIDRPTDCEFLLDHAIDEEAAGKRKKPYRYRWPDRVCDEVLARLLELNAERAAEQARPGRVAAPAGADRLSG